MADIRCPMCGKDNPEHLEACQYCEARLTPLQAGEPRPDDSAPDGADDWLMALRANDGSTDDDDDDDLPDWLRDLGADDTDESLPEDKAVTDKPEDPEDLPDWQEQTQVSALDAPVTDAAESDDETVFAEFEPKDLSKEVIELNSVISDPEPSVEEAPAETIDSEATDSLSPEVVPDWLSELDPVDDVAKGDSGLDWLTELGNEGRKTEGSLPEEESEAVSGWLSVAGDTPEPGTSADKSDDIPEWVAEFNIEEEIEEAESLPDWIQEMSPEEAVAEESPDLPVVEQEKEAAAEGFPDWLGEFEETITDETVQEPAAAEEVIEESDVEGLPDWLGEFEEATAEETVQKPAAVEEVIEESVAEGLPDWLGEFEEATAEETVQEPVAAEEVIEEAAVEELPEWLGEFEEETPGEALPDTVLSEELPYLTGELEEAATESVEEPAPEGLPDWLQELGQQAGIAEQEPEEAAAQVFAEETAETGEVTAEGLPDWLNDFEEASPEENLEGFAAAVVGAETLSGDEPEAEALPDWLQELQASGDADAHEVMEELPDWLSDGDAETEPIKPTEGKLDPSDFISGTADEAASEEDQPEWLDDLPFVEKADQAAEAVGDEEIPAWLKEFKDDQADEVPAWLSSALGPLGDLDPDDRLTVPEPIEEELTPDIEDWLANLNTDMVDGEADEGEVDLSDLISDPEAESEEPARTISEEAPDWLGELQEKSVGEFEFESGTWDPLVIPEPEEEKEDAEPDPVDWLPKDDDSLSIDRLASGEGVEEGVSPGELPDWLKAMRPNETTLSGTMEASERDTGSIEKIGPLAGLRGVLSAEPSASQTGRTPSHFVRLQITDAQQFKADELQKMVSSETSPQPAKRGSILSEQRVLRYIIAAVLFFIVVFPLFIPGNLTPLPPRPVEMEQLDDLISSLDNSSHVLIGLDYQPGMSGEMDAAASSVVDHLLLRQPKLALVSTQLTGPALGERLIHFVESQHGYSAGSQYVNLGYLPGDSTGLHLFAKAPLEATRLGYDDRPIWELLDTEANNPWQQPALLGIDSLDDFDMTLLISDDPDTIRRWIEQISPALRMKSFAVVSSAQAEPLVRPYFDAPQSPVVAFVPGLAGGAGYEGFLLREGPGRAAWDAYGLGSLMGIILILGAGTYNLYVLWKEREAERRGRR